ncbi:GIY-YIG nuclease family protein [Ktedonobacteria bacterium brp13]|nr:GIY-YIG nuclease family protein [Ktedonobacteria bacterium brp13]
MEQGKIGDLESLGSTSAKDELPQRGTLLRRAYELLETLGQPAAEDILIQHLFGANGNKNLWTVLLRQTLRSSSLFVETGESGFTREVRWSLSSWQSTQRLLHEVDFVVIDTETTGIRPGPDRVIEVGAVRIHNGVIADSYQSLINPQRRLPPFIVSFTHIMQAMVDAAPVAATVIPELLDFCEGATLVGHNLGFDVRFLSHEAQLLGLAFPIEGVDTIPLARRFLPGLKRFKLDTLAAHLQIQTVNRHRALGDAEVTAEAFIKMLALAQKQNIVTLGHLQRRLQLPVAWSGDITQVHTSKEGHQWSADSKLSPSAVATGRPNGGLFLNPAWKRNFPLLPGVYLMKNEDGEVIYVGKAKCLKDRLSSYYSQPLGYTRKMDGLLQNVKEIETRVLGSELEALLVESRLIKELQPVYNVQLRNYELYPFIKIDVQHPFPRVYATREVAADGARYFGPFRSRRIVDLTIELIQKVFPIRTCTRGMPPAAKPSDPCLRLHLGRCSGPCRGNDDAEAYRKVIDEVCAFLGGAREDLLDRLRRQMLEAAQQLNFERAAWLRDAIHSADEILIGQKLITGAVESNNLYIIYPSALDGHNEIFVVRHGRLVAQRCVVHERETMQAALHELLTYAREWGAAPSIVGKAEVDQINIISRWIHHHSEDRAFFPFQHALEESAAHKQFISYVWGTLEEARITREAGVLAADASRASVAFMESASMVNVASDDGIDAL